MMIVTQQRLVSGSVFPHVKTGIVRSISLTLLPPLPLIQGSATQNGQ